MSGRGVAVNDDQIRGLVPVGRRGTVEDIASAVCYLASDEAGYITRTCHGRRRRLESQMITKFSVLYVGQIELENVGLQGTPANDRRYGNERLAEAFHTAKDVAQHMDELGYYCLWTAEHHFQHEGYEVFPNLILLGTWLATQTKRLKLGCAFNVLPMWHPLRLAEDYAAADIMTNGRVIMGVGRGYHTREVETLRRAHARQQGEPGAVRGADGGAPQGLQPGVLLAPRQALPDPAAGGVPRLHAPRGHAGAPAPPPAGGDLAAHRLRKDAAVHRPARDQGHGDAQRREDLRSGRARLPGGGGARRGGRSRSARISAGASGSTWPTRRRRPSGAWSRITTSATSGSRPSASCATRTPTGASWGTPGAPARIPSIRDGVEQKAWLCGPPKHVIEGIRHFERTYPGPRPDDDPLGRGHGAEGVQGAAQLVRPRGHAGLHQPAVADGRAPGGIPPPRSPPSWEGPPGIVFFPCAPS